MSPTKLAALELDLPAAEYHARPGLSASGMKDLAVSPLRYWFKHVNPNRPADEPTPEMQIGSALHCAVLEPDAFDERYACEVEAPEDCLVTIEDLRNWLRARNVTPKGTRKADVIAQVLGTDHTANILEVIEAEHTELHRGKLIFKRDDWVRIAGMTQALRDEPHVNRLLENGDREVSMFAEDPDTGVLLKARMDWVTVTETVDFKTFTQKRGKSIDKSVADAILYEQYYRQAVVYGIVRGWPQNWHGDFVMPFVESDPPHETRIRLLRPKTGGEVNLYWERARFEVRQLIRTYAECMAKFGANHPWRYAQEITPLADEEMPGMAF